MKRNDILLAVSILFAAGLFSLFLFLQENKPGSQVSVTVDGRLYGIYSLNEDQDIEVETALGYNLIRIESGKVFMLEADCPDGYCKKQGKIISTKETIVCLPHKLIVEIQTAADPENRDYDLLIQ